MESVPEATVIVPAFNVERYIRRCIDSITRTTRRAIELLVVDDGSTDGTGRIADELSRGDPRIRVIHTENNGASAARNVALDLSRGRFVYFVDADDCVEDDFIDRSIDLCESSGCEALLLRATFEDSKGTATPQLIDPEVDERILSGASPVYAGYPLYLWNFAFSRDAIGPVRFDVTLRVSEDADFISRVCPRVRRFAIDPNPGYRYSVGRPESALTEIDLEGCLDIKRVKAELIRRAGEGDDISRVVDEYGAASFGVLRRCARVGQLYYREVRLPGDLLRALESSRSPKAMLCVRANRHETLYRPLFILLSLLGTKVRVK